jgi:hypothetical protein
MTLVEEVRWSSCNRGSCASVFRTREKLALGRVRIVVWDILCVRAVTNSSEEATEVVPVKVRSYNLGRGGIVSYRCGRPSGIVSRRISFALHSSNFKRFRHAQESVVPSTGIASVTQISVSEQGNEAQRYVTRLSSINAWMGSLKRVVPADVMYISELRNPAPYPGTIFVNAM